ncbi:MAG TPA: peptidase MA family metallohydrolase [Anaerolineae bacterium]|nr:peptidase MA family metallohydrolase [Anaerolineae bacterium]
MSRRILLLLLTLALLVTAVFSITTLPVRAQDTITVSNDEPLLEFPDRLTFRAKFQNDRPIEKVVLEYGVDQWTCGTVVAKAFPDIKPGKEVATNWTWEMKQSGSQPPGAKIWWRWHIFDDQGKEIVTNRKETVWLDDQHDWQTVSGNDINLHWYAGGASFGRELHDSAVKSLDDLAKTTGLRTSKPVDLYIYANTNEMRDAVLYEPDWTGGLAEPEHNIVFIGIPSDQMDWGKRTEAHELTHVLVGQLTFSCLSDIPTWLNEGLAVYGEGGPEDYMQEALDKAVKDNTILPVRSLAGGFSEDPAKANASYGQSYSLVKYLVDNSGQTKMLDFLGKLRDGATVDEALQQVYGFDTEGFEDAWRADIGAQPRSSSTAKPTATPVPTMVPTFVPASVRVTGPTAAPTRDRPTPTPIVVAQATGEAAQPVPTVAAPADEAAPASILPAVIVAIGVVIVTTIITALIVGRRKQRMDV